MKKPGSARDPLWYKDAVIYEVHVKAFFDSNNDGTGDFPGLLEKLDYLEDQVSDKPMLRVRRASAGDQLSVPDEALLPRPARDHVAGP